MLKRVVFGKVASPRIAQLVDLNRREIVVFASLALIVLMVGVDPKPFTDAIDPTVARLIDEAGQSKVPDAEGATPARSSFVASVRD